MPQMLTHISKPSTVSLRIQLVVTSLSVVKPEMCEGQLGPCCSALSADGFPFLVSFQYLPAYGNKNVASGQLLLKSSKL